MMNFYTLNIIENIGKFFSSLFDLILDLYSFIVSFLKSLFDFLVNIPSYLSIITSSISSLPVELLPFFGSVLVISILFIILGRGKSN